MLKSNSLSSKISSTSRSGWRLINSCILGVSQVVPKLTTVVTVSFPVILSLSSLKVDSTSFNFEITSLAVLYKYSPLLVKTKPLACLSNK